VTTKVWERVGLFILMMAMATRVAAADTSVCALDTKTAAKICIEFLREGFRLESVSWSGPIVDGKAEGKGHLSWVYVEKDGTKKSVQGDVEMKAGFMDGKATITMSNGASYDGYLKAGQFEGKCIFLTGDGGSYEGTFKANALDVWGKRKQANGDVYEGEYRDGVANGKGKMTSPRAGLVYEGDWKDGVGDGQGVYRWANGKSYQGAIKNNRPHGYGVMRDANGKVEYEGEWNNGAKAKTAD
jgi:hypothetical protein